MKIITNTTKIFLLTATLLLFSFAYASNREKGCTLKIETGNGKAISFILTPDEETSLSIYDQQHNLIYESAVNKLDVLKTISLAGFSDGIYYLEVASREKTVRHEIKLISKDLKKIRREDSANESPSLRR
ncbi:secretion protein [uncultured Flavobacterium sp.]|uniref:secretion protein n=1 Tax=uncultured Flavobacterium sp. TaxID=165435 RepID=UPI0025CF083F|nr:secretion protein [uncultured Flavobacterium sp.]